MSTTTALVLPDTPAAIGAAYGLPVNESKDVRAHLKAIKAATPATLVDALREHGAPLYGNADTLRADVDAARKFATQGKAAADAADAMAVRLVMVARQVNPKVTATAIGRAVEGDDAEGAAMRKRWSRYSNAAKMTAARAAAIKAGTTTDNLTVRDALLALQQQYAPVAELIERAETGRPMPKGPESEARTTTDANREPRKVTGADVVKAAERFADAVKACDASDLSPEQVALIGSILQSVRTRLGAK